MSIERVVSSQDTVWADETRFKCARSLRARAACIWARVSVFVTKKRKSVCERIDSHSRIILMCFRVTITRSRCCFCTAYTYCIRTAEEYVWTCIMYKKSISTRGTTTMSSMTNAWQENMPNNSALLNIRSFSLPAFKDDYISLIND